MGEAFVTEGRRSATAQAAAVQVRVLRSAGELASIGEEWDSLVLGAAGSGQAPMSSYAWISSHLELRHPKDRPWFCLAAFDGDELVGVLPIEERRVRVLGKTVTSLHQPRDPHTMIVDAVVRLGYEEAVMAGFREVLDEVSPGWYGLEMTSIEERSAFLRAFPSAFAGMNVVQSRAGLATVCGTRGRWDEYFAGCSAHFRHHFRRYGRKLAKQGVVEAEFITGLEAGGPEWLERFVALEYSCWKGRAGSAIAANEALLDFYRLLCARLYCRQALEWYFLKVDDKYVAGHLMVRSGRTVVLWKAGFDEEYGASSPGLLLIGEMLKWATADPGTDEVNFVTDRPWLDSWRPEKRRYYDLWVYPKRVRPTVAGVWPKRARQRLREMPGLKKALNGVRGFMRR